MARTLGCADVGYDCVFRVVADNDEDDLILDTALAHAKRHHPEIVGDEKALKDQLKHQIKTLLKQAGYEKDSSAPDSTPARDH